VRAFGRSVSVAFSVAISQLRRWRSSRYASLLIVVVVGIFDFGEAFNVKQKLNGAARGARFASSLPTNDLSAAVRRPR